MDVEVDNSSIEVNADALRVKALGVTNAMLAGSIDGAKIENFIFTDESSTQGAITIGKYGIFVHLIQLFINNRR